MRRLAPLLLLAMAACSDLRPLPLVQEAPGPEQPQSAMRQMIRMQLGSQGTEPPPTPVPGSEAARLGTLQALPMRGGGRAESGGEAAGMRGGAP